MTVLLFILFILRTQRESLPVRVDFALDIIKS